MTPAERPALSVAETAELLGISRWLVQQAVRDGSLPSVRVGRRILIPRLRLEAWLDGSGAAGDPAGGTRTADSRVG
jgi:excisionase family DNA binding protein